MDVQLSNLISREGNVLEEHMESKWSLQAAVTL